MKKIALFLIVLVAVNCVSSRWLPTRDNTDRLDKLREMLRDILESEYEKSLYSKATIFKREATGPSLNSLTPLAQHLESRVSAASNAAAAEKH